MSYDPQKTRDLLKVAQAFANNPMGEYAQQLAQQLIDCEADMKAVVVTATDYRTQAEEATRRFESEARAHRETREKLGAGQIDFEPRFKLAVAALEQIKADARGAKKVAADALVKVST